MTTAVVIALDAGTTGVRAMAVDPSGAVLRTCYQEFPQYFPRPGWVEHDAEEIWTAVSTTLGEVLADLDRPLAAIGLTNQRETAVVWDRRTGLPLHRALVWQDRRGTQLCASLQARGYLDLIRTRTGLVLDPYFSATKLSWLFREGGVQPGREVAFGTIDSWLLWRLTGGRVHATDPSNASRTLLFDIRRLTWDEELADLFGVPGWILPDIVASSGRLGVTAQGVAPDLPSGVPISGVAGDQQAALFGQACFAPGMTKNTYGTGSFVLMNVGSSPPEPAPGLLTTVAWSLAQPAEVAYALEGAIFVTGAAVQWLRDQLGLITSAEEIETLAASVDDTGGAYLVPAFAGLGSPYWDPFARGTLVGLSRGVGRAQLARAVIESMAFQTRDVVDTMHAAAGHALTELRVDGGASVMDLLLQGCADLLRVPVVRASTKETTALGAAWLAGLAEGVWASLEDLSSRWLHEATFTPAQEPSALDAAYGAWRRAVERAASWERL
jgi:glycerol kinase